MEKIAMNSETLGVSPENLETPLDIEKVTQLYSHCNIVHQINDGDLIDIGHEPGRPEKPFRLKVDAERMKQWVGEVNERSSAITGVEYKNEVSRLLSIIGGEIDPEVWYALYQINRKLEDIRQEAQERHGTNLYIDYNRKLKFHETGQYEVYESFIDGNAMCAEMSAFSQLSLQDLSINSEMINGAFCRDKVDYSSIAHSFILITLSGGSQLIYDPAKPIKIKSSLFPKINQVPNVFFAPNSFKEEIYSIKPILFECKSIYKRLEAGGFYGTDDYSNPLNPEILKPLEEK